MDYQSSRRGALLGACAALAGCATLTNIGKAVGVLTPSGALSLYGIAKGVAEVAVVADPALAPLVAGIVAVADPIAQVITAETAQTLATHANNLLVATAQAVTVVPNKS